MHVERASLVRHDQNISRERVDHGTHASETVHALEYRGADLYAAAAVWLQYPAVVIVVVLPFLEEHLVPDGLVHKVGYVVGAFRENPELVVHGSVSPVERVEFYLDAETPENITIYFANVIVHCFSSLL